jgi:hypothetical protein
MTRRNWLRLWSGIAGIALAVALILTFIPVAPAITIGGTLSIGVDYPNQGVPTSLEIGDEVVSLRTGTSKTYYLGNDTYEARIYTASSDPNDPWYYSGANDGDYFATSSVNYNTVWNLTSWEPKAYLWLDIGQDLTVGYYSIARGFIFFDTSTIPSGVTIAAASLNFYGYADWSTTDFLITIQNGQPTYPHDPAVAGDYYKANYAGDGGSLTTVGFTLVGYNTIPLNADGISWINKGGQTKFFIRSSKDIAGTAPTGLEYVSMYLSEEAGTSKDPYLAVTYTPLPWLTGYTYRQEFTIAGTTDGAQTNYQMSLTVNKTGTGSTGSTVCLNDRSLSWTGTVPNDIRFTKLDGTTQLDYWIESSDANTAKVWVEFDSIPVGPNNASFYIYYGKASDTTTSSIVNTFPFADDFNDASIDGAKWFHWIDNGSESETGGIFALVGAAGYNAWGAKTKFGTNYAYRGLVKVSTEGGTDTNIFGFDDRSDDGTYVGAGVDNALFSYSEAKYFITYRESTPTVTARADALTAYSIVEIQRNAGTNVRFLIGDALKATVTTNVPTDTCGLFLYADTAITISWDWVLVRKYTVNEPTWGSWGPEEGGPAITNSQSAWAMGYVQVNDVRYFSAGGAQDDDYATVTNTGTCPVNVAIQGLDMEGGAYDWTLASAAGNQTYSLYANSGNGSSTYNTEVKKSSYSNLCAALVVNGTYLWSMKFTAPTIYSPSDDGAQKTTTVTLVATAS